MEGIQEEKSNNRKLPQPQVCLHYPSVYEFH